MVLDRILRRCRAHHREPGDQQRFASDDAGRSSIRRTRGGVQCASSQKPVARQHDATLITRRVSERDSLEKPVTLNSVRGCIKHVPFRT